MSDIKTFGQALDAFLTDQVPIQQSVESLYMYREDYSADPKVIINKSEQDYDYTQIMFEVVELIEIKNDLQAKVKAAQDKLRLLEKAKRDVEKAIKLLKA